MPGNAARARAVANAAGPWAGGVLERMRGGGDGPALRLVQGSHIVVRRPWPAREACLLQQADGRVVFLLPFAHDHLLVGTTNTDYRGDPARCSVLPAEIAYLCAAATAYLRTPVTPDDVVWQFAGVRPLLSDPDPQASQLSRDYRLQLDTEGAPALHVLGGKLTTYRVLAEEALDRLAPLLHGCDSVAALGEDFGGGLHAREVQFLCDHEWAQTADDILWRRSKLGLRLDAAQVARLQAWLQARAG
ncbi:MAG: Aerobic glycerol-3-phosphate dehydrogenase [Stenotrophomonas maltophilia]|uniref:Aerobic glycerol-3-phosphate dehydrogenase n=1 Tax=Stenotrophomonas maltophilia TaxID=40324 RepID=A0A7V8FFZ3_STEMA|nr:MAG: Aerobic glycerol-3-phosphate dehydrogenase [Stenotrophomonas maltophilia]